MTDPLYTRATAGILQGTAFVVASASWELVSRLELLPSRYLPPFSAVMARFVELLGSSKFWAGVGETAKTWTIGILIAFAIGLTLGLLIGTWQFTIRSTRLIIDFLRSVPPVAMIPLLILQFGATSKTKLILVVYAAVFPILIGAIVGASGVDKGFREFARAYRIGQFTRYFKITLPASAPYVMSGVKVAASIAVIVAVVVEIITGAPGLGSQMTEARLGQDFEAVYALILTAGLLGALVTGLVRLVEPLAIGWHPSVRVKR